MTFEKRRTAGVVRWQAGCNVLGSEVDITADRLLLEEIAGTEIGCPAELAAQDEWLIGFFRSEPQWELKEELLRLSSGPTAIELEEERS